MMVRSPPFLTNAFKTPNSPLYTVKQHLSLSPPYVNMCYNIFFHWFLNDKRSV